MIADNADSQRSPPRTGVRPIAFERKPLVARLLTAAPLRVCWAPIAAALIVAGATTGADFARGCETPVYRFAMYNWPPADYTLYALRSGDADSARRGFLAVVGEVEARVAPVNFSVVAVDVSDEGADKLPESVRSAWDARDPKASELNVVVCPNGWSIGSPAEIDDAALGSWLDSPARRVMVERLSAGDCCVLVVLGSADAAALSAAREQALAAARRAAEGAVRPYALAGFEEPETASAEALGVSVIAVDRNDPAEAGLVASLLGVEQDLRDYQEPMVFCVYGRGRAMEPCLGAGVTPENLDHLIAFAAGACSCEVKEQNPGMDLLVAANWDAIAHDIAEKFGAETGNENILGVEGTLAALIPHAPTTASEPSGSPPASARAELASAPPDHSADGHDATNRKAADAPDDSELLTSDSGWPRVVYFSLAAGVLLALAVATMIVRSRAAA